MVAAGGQRIVTIAVAGGRDKIRACTPCGGCRQRIHEFSDSDTRIIFKDNDNEWHTCSMDDLLPSSFHL